MRGPGRARGRGVRDLTINADLATTVVDISGASPTLTLDGLSLLPPARRPRVERGRELLLETNLYQRDPHPALRLRRAQRGREGALRPAGSTRTSSRAATPIRPTTRAPAAGRAAGGAARLRGGQLRPDAGAASRLQRQARAPRRKRRCSKPPVSGFRSWSDRGGWARSSSSPAATPAGTDHSAPFPQRKLRRRDLRRGRARGTGRG